MIYYKKIDRKYFMIENQNIFSTDSFIKNFVTKVNIYFSYSFKLFDYILIQ